MKSKLSQILLMGAVTVSLGMFVSCKDTSADLYKQLELRVDDNAQLQDAIEAKLQQLEALKQQLEEKMALLKPCNCPENMAQTIQELTNFMNKMNEATADKDQSLETLKGLIQGITENYTTITNFFNNIGVSEAELQAAVDLLNARIDAIKQCECDLAKLALIEQTAQEALSLAQQANTKAGEAQQLAQTAKTAAEEAISKANAAQTTANEAKELINSLKTIAEAADKLSKENKEKIEANTQAINNINLQLSSMSTDLLAASTKANEAYAQAFTNKTTLETLSPTVEANKTALQTLTETTIPGLQTAINGLTEKVNGMAEDIENLKPEITKLYEYADATLEKAKAYTDLEVALVRADINGLDLKVFNLGEDLNGAVEDITALKTAVQEINTAISGLDTRISENTTKIGELKSDLENVQTELQGKIDNLQAEIDDLTEDVKKNTEDIEKLTGVLDLLQENLKRQVTGIIVQETYNPAFGTFKLPAGVQSNVLLAFYGEAYQNVEFPTNRTVNYVDERYVLSYKDLQMLDLAGKDPLFKAKAGDVIMQNDENNAGTLYLTVNPNTVDFSKLQLSLVNSQDQESYIKLGTLERSDKILQLGFSRSADNGFYECTANLSPEDINNVQKINFNASSLKEAVTEIINKRSSSDITKIASDMADLIKGLRIDATAVKCEWEDSVKEGETAQKHAVYSNYNLAATAIKPLSLQTAKDFHYETVPGYEKVMDLINQVSDSIKSAIDVVFDNVQGQPVVKKIQGLTINKIENLDGTFSISKEITIDGLKYTLGVMDVDIPIVLTDIPVDLGTINVPVPSLAINGNAQTAEVVVNIYKDPDLPAGTGAGQLDNPSNIVGQAKIPAQNIVIDANSTATVVPVTIDGKKITITKDLHTTINMNKTLYFGDNGTDKKSFTIDVDITSTINQIWGNVQGSVNPTLEQVEDIVKDVNTMLSELNDYKAAINAKVDNFMDLVSSKLSSLNKRLVGFVNDTNLRLQPVLVASDGTGSKFLSEAENYPTELGSDITFVPTSWTLELLVPYAKKHVAIVDVINGDKSAKGGDSGCLSELRRANGSPTLNTLLPGNERRAYATGLKSGYVYEIAYSALDLHGKMATRKYYIRIK